MLIAIILHAATGGLSAQPIVQRNASQSSKQRTEAGAANSGAVQPQYDPLAGRPHFRGGLWDNVLNGINPQNRDLGQCLSEGRQIAVRATIESAAFWTATVNGLLLGAALIYLYWLLHDRARRLDVTVTLLTQVSNAYLDARDHALDAIEKHNRLADDYNVLAEKMAASSQQQSENRQRVRQEFRAKEGELRSAPETAVNKDTSAQDGAALQLRPLQTSDADAQAARRVAQQITALQEKNKTLRTSLNEVLAENEQLKRERAEMRGV